MAGKKKRIHCDFSSEASIDNPQIKVVAVITSNSRVDAVITSGSTQGSANDIDMSLPHVSTYIKNALQRRFVDFRHKLKKHFDSYPTLEEAQQNKHEDVTSHEEWKFLCDRYESVQFKEEMIGMKNGTTLPDGTVTLTDDEIVLEVLGHKSGYFKGPSKFLSSEDFVLSKHLEERVETQQ
ncbi:hypothetical protein C1H46_026602 [Malus baccata]|uniref:Uncharacterized protein n=1 Tax=Malus baccata TaxID=106549 RepID=A0A540LNJ1_MALBA|nr:hypothetical protein C1H46_026602 [Malus baccata]